MTDVGGETNGTQHGERTQIVAILLVTVALWALFTSLALDPTTGVYSPFNPDTYATLTIARMWAQGHPWRLNPGDPPCTMLPYTVSPTWVSIGDWLGFPDTSVPVLAATRRWMSVRMLSMSQQAQGLGRVLPRPRPPRGGLP